MFASGILILSSAVFNGIWPHFDGELNRFISDILIALIYHCARVDHNNKMFMRWDAIGPELDRFGVQPKRKGSKMLADFNGTWRVVQVTVPQSKDSLNVVCDVLDNGGAVVQAGVVLDTKQLKGLPYSDGLYRDILNALRKYYDTPVGTFCLIIKPLVRLLKLLRIKSSSTHKST